MLVHQASCVVQAHQDFVPGPHHREHRSDLFAQGRHRGGTYVAVKVQDEDARALAVRAPGLAALRPLFPQPAAEGLLRQHGAIHRRGNAPIPAVEILDLEMLRFRAPTDAARRQGHGDHHREYSSQCLGQKQAVGGGEVIHLPSRADDRSARPSLGACRT